ncbi:hypothetical protein Hanom_Chr09g00809911 [Helianthus anomalus]
MSSSVCTEPSSSLHGVVVKPDGPKQGPPVRDKDHRFETRTTASRRGPPIRDKTAAHHHHHRFSLSSLRL